MSNISKLLLKIDCNSIIMYPFKKTSHFKKFSYSGEDLNICKNLTGKKTSSHLSK